MCENKKRRIEKKNRFDAGEEMSGQAQVSKRLRTEASDEERRRKRREMEKTNLLYPSNFHTSNPASTTFDAKHSLLNPIASSHSTVRHVRNALPLPALSTTKS
jgi:hypothetical protein